ncbi:unnamed protein product [Effrenium voratum]|uniref:ATP-dependent rRNA helicase SPB4-like C-terminal extension domain-containing protein n=1 Tax=Effrenium voratum TaxID=2562239 RepID=A0AA36HSG9_9DINO|nr:unnamed protein product [Effrenium voratum]
MKCCLEGTGSKHFPAVSGTRQGLIAGHLASRVAAQAPLASRARSGFLASLKAYRSFPRELRSCFPFSQLHLGHLATSFALREAPRDVVKKDRYERTAEPEALKKGKARAERQKGGKKRGKGEGKGKGGKGGKSGKGGKGGKGGPGMKARPGKSPGVNAADEFAS